MPGRVGILHRVEARIRIAMIVQRIARGRHDRIRREELAQRRVIPAGAVVVEIERLFPKPVFRHLLADKTIRAASSRHSVHYPSIPEVAQKCQSNENKTKNGRNAEPAIDPDDSKPNAKQHIESSLCSPFPKGLVSHIFITVTHQQEKTYQEQCIVHGYLQW